MPSRFSRVSSTNPNVDESQCHIRVPTLSMLITQCHCAWCVLWLFSSYVEVIGNATLSNAKNVEKYVDIIPFQVSHLGRF